VSKFGLTVVNAKTTGRNLRLYDFELKERRMYYLDLRFVRAREKLHKTKRLRRLYCTIIILVILEPDLANAIERDGKGSGRTTFQT
jgi:hypothetical protein